MDDKTFLGSRIPNILLTELVENIKDQISVVLLRELGLHKVKGMLQCLFACRQVSR